MQNKPIKEDLIINTDSPDALNNIEQIINNETNTGPKSFFKRLGINITSKITTRDLVIFTQDLYLLKKANFKKPIYPCYYLYFLALILGKNSKIYLKNTV